MAGSIGEKPGTKILDYIALGLLLAPPAVGVEVYLRDGTLGGWRLAILTAVCWIAGGFVVLASHYWQAWRSADGRILPILVAIENKFWGKGVIIAAAMGGALALSSFFAPPPIVVHDAPSPEVLSKPAINQTAQNPPAEVSTPVVAPSPSASETRSFTNKRVLDFIPTLAGVTELQAQILSADEKGKWMNVDGVVRNVAPNMVLTIGPDEGGQVRCIFDQKWVSKLAMLRQGDKLKVDGKIEEYIGGDLMLEECEVL